MFDTDFVSLCQMAAVLNFIHNKMLNYSLATQLNWAYLETDGIHQNREALSILSKMYQFIVLTLYHWRQSWILLAMQ